MRYFGPFKVLKKFGIVAYRLHLPLEAYVHPVFHVSVLKTGNGDSHNFSSSIPLPLISTEEDAILQPKGILQFRTIFRNGHQIVQAVVQWDYLSSEDNTWEDVDQLLEHFPNLDLDDKVNFNGGGNVLKRLFTFSADN